ncbi:peptidylprolyl isomerase [Candidatus Kinetoplastidibacterium galati]|uniref:Periplasmic chaperone PpiD n=1 Tax=Candidatus Kinetoplastidibacterium galati TCC219 TaxID=1208921 RepID=M1LY24_9PROT|nr:peptidylprolyl isomerase [Candidatus Kinetoplastibacterium galatii]AGF48976.1 putative chaperone [Candidatus Kinetoplastibacterium galatii TCC219]
MFEFIRNKSRFILLILFFLITPAIFFSGVFNYKYEQDDPKIAKFGDIYITLGEFNIAYSGFLDQLRSNVRNCTDMNMIDTPEMREQFLEELINTKLLSLVSSDMNISVTDERLRDYISSLDWGNGKGNFSNDNYVKVLSNYGMTPAEFEYNQRKFLSAKQITDSIASSGIASKVILNKYLDSMTQKRVIRTRMYNFDSYKSLVDISPEEINSWYLKNKDFFKKPENVDIEYIVIDEVNCNEDLDIDDSEAKSFYKKNLDKFTVPGKFSFESIFFSFDDIKTNEEKLDLFNEAKTVLNKLDGNPDCILFSKDSSNSNFVYTNYDLSTEEEILEALGQEAKDAILKLAKGQHSKLLETSCGLYIFRLNEISLPRVLPFKDAKNKIIIEIQQDYRHKCFCEKIDRVRELIYNEDYDIESIALDIGVKVSSLRGLTKNGVAIDDKYQSIVKNNYLNNYQVLSVIFSNEASLDKNYFGLVQVSPSVFIVVKVLKYNASSIFSLSEVSGKIRSLVLEDKVRVLAMDDVNRYIESVSKNNKFDKSKFSEKIEISRFESDFRLPKELVNAVMSMPTSSLPYYGKVNVDSGILLVYLENILNKKNDDPLIDKQISDSLIHSTGKSEWLATLRFLKNKYKLKLLDHVDDVINN